LLGGLGYTPERVRSLPSIPKHRLGYGTLSENAVTGKDQMNIKHCQPADVIQPSWHNSYEQRIERLWWELVWLNSNLFVLEKLSAFPFELFLQPLRGNFFSLVQVNLFNMCILIIRKLVEEKDPRSLTLSRFKQDVQSHIRPKYESSLDAALDDVEFDATISDLLERARKIRNKRVAHFDRKFNLSPKQQKEIRLSLVDLMELRDALNKLFETLCFGHRRSVLPWQYDPRVQHPPDLDARSDVEELLNRIAKDSHILNMPEQQPNFWPHFREGLSQKELQMLNQHRTKFGLREV